MKTITIRRDDDVETITIDAVTSGTTEIDGVEYIFVDDDEPTYIPDMMAYSREVVRADGDGVKGVRTAYFDIKDADAEMIEDSVDWDAGYFDDDDEPDADEIKSLVREAWDSLTDAEKDELAKAWDETKAGADGADDLDAVDAVTSYIETEGLGYISQDTTTDSIRHLSADNFRAILTE